MHFLFRNINIYTNLGSISRFYSTARKTHYEVLRVPRNCTDKQIKDAFIQLSKEYHPDKNKDAKAQEKFVRIVEAYSVLSKPSSRAKYDCVRVEYTPRYEYTYKKPHEPYYRYRNYQYSRFYENSNEYKTSNNDTENKKYYGMHNVNKVNNSVIMLICASIAVIGFLLQMLLIRQSFFTHRRQAEEKSKRIALELEKVKTAAVENGNQRQTQLLLEKIVNQSNPTVATAILGQSLANPKNRPTDP